MAEKNEKSRGSVDRTFTAGFGSKAGGPENSVITLKGEGGTVTFTVPSKDAGAYETGKKFVVTISAKE